MFDWQILLDNLIKLGISFLLALPIAIDRERSTHLMGLRTFAVVSVGSCAYILVSLGFIPEGSDPNANARVLQGLITGIGFVGGGAILKDKDRVMGTATASSIWAMGAVGAGVAHEIYEVAVVIALATFLLLRWLTPLKDIIEPKK